MREKKVSVCEVGPPMPEKCFKSEEYRRGYQAGHQRGRLNHKHYTRFLQEWEIALIDATQRLGRSEVAQAFRELAERKSTKLAEQCNATMTDHHIDASDLNYVIMPIIDRIWPSR